KSRPDNTFVEGNDVHSQAWWRSFVEAAKGCCVADDFRVVLVDKWGHVLERDGTFYFVGADHPHFEARFTDFDSARRFCEEVVKELPQVECDVTHRGQMVLQHFDPVWREREEEEIRQLFDAQRRQGWLILAALVGLVVVVVTLVLWVR